MPPRRYYYVLLSDLTWTMWTDEELAELAVDHLECDVAAVIPSTASVDLNKLWDFVKRKEAEKKGAIREFTREIFR
jgi:hypothetical protein